MISSNWPMPQNLKVSNNESSNSINSTESNKDSSVFNNTDIQNFIASKQEFIINSSLNPKIKSELKTALDDLAKFINHNQLKGGHVQIGFAVDDISELSVVQEYFQEHFIDQPQQQFNYVYDPKGKVPFPKQQTIGTVDLDDPF
jgi:hypothetical protein